MQKMKTHVPLGLLFEEPVPEHRDTVVPTYDDEADLSYIDYDGRRVPWAGIVEAVMVDAGAKTRNPFDVYSEADGRLRVLIQDSLMGTETVTKIMNESTDTD